MRYSDLRIKTLDQKFIDDLLDEYNLDPNDITINMSSIWDSLTNEIIYAIYSEAIEQLEISDEAKDLLHDNIHTNYLDSWIDLSYEDLDNTDLINEEKEIIEKFLNN